MSHAHYDWYFHPETGAQLKGPQWAGPRPAAVHPRRSRVEAQEGPSRGRDTMIVPGSGLEQLLRTVRRRSTRRLILAAVQSRNPKRARSLERLVQRALAKENA